MPPPFFLYLLHIIWSRAGGSGTLRAWFWSSLDWCPAVVLLQGVRGDIMDRIDLFFTQECGYPFWSPHWCTSYRFVCKTSGLTFFHSMVRAWATLSCNVIGLRWWPLLVRLTLAWLNLTIKEIDRPIGGRVGKKSCQTAICLFVVKDFNRSWVLSNYWWGNCNSGNLWLTLFCCKSAVPRDSLQNKLEA